MVFGRIFNTFLYTTVLTPFKVPHIGNYINIMERLLQELEKTVEDFNNINQIKGFNAKYSIWDRTSTEVLWQVIVKRLSDKVTREKYILLDTKLDIRI